MAFRVLWRIADRQAASGAHPALRGGPVADGIAQEVGISRQGVHELLTRAARKMFEMEEKLHVAARFQRVENGLEKCRTMMREGRYDDAERMIDALIRFDQEENNGL